MTHPVGGEKMAYRSVLLLAPGLFVLSLATPAAAEQAAPIEKLRAVPDDCADYASKSDFGPRVGKLLESCQIQFLDSFGHAAPMGVSRVVPGGLAAEIGLSDGDMIVDVIGIRSHAARPPFWFYCLVDSGQPFDIRVQRYAGRQITLTFPGASAD